MKDSEVYLQSRDTVRFLLGILVTQYAQQSHSCCSQPSAQLSCAADGQQTTAAAADKPTEVMRMSRPTAINLMQSVPSAMLRCFLPHLT